MVVVPSRKDPLFFLKIMEGFRRYDHFYTVVTKEIEKRVDHTVLSYLRNIASPGVIIPFIIILM